MSRVCNRCLLFVLFLGGLIGCGGGGGGSTPPPPPQNPPPTLISVNPDNTLANSSELSITAAGANFISSSKIQWDGTQLNTTYISATSLQAEVHASNFSQPAVHHVSVVTPSPGGGTSGQKTFIVVAPSGTRVTVLDVPANDIVWDPRYKKIYASQPSSAPSSPDSIAVIDPVAATISTSQPVGEEPTLLAISDDSQYLYTSLNASGSIQRFTLPDLAKDLAFSLGLNPPYGPYQATSLQVAPGSPHTAAVVLGVAPFFGMGPGVIYDDSTPRRLAIPSVADGGPGVGQVQWGRDAYSLCAEPYGIGGGEVFCYDVNAAGATLRNRFGQSGHFLEFTSILIPGLGISMQILEVFRIRSRAKRSGFIIRIMSGSRTSATIS